MSNDRIEPGFDHRSRHRETAQQRTALALIATIALAVSTAVAATVVSIGMARADMLGPVDSDNGPFALALFLGLVLASMGWLTAAMTRNERKPPRSERTN